MSVSEVKARDFFQAPNEQRGAILRQSLSPDGESDVHLGWIILATVVYPDDETYAI